MSLLGIADVLGQKLHQCSRATWVLRHLLHHVEGLFRLFDLHAVWHFYGFSLRECCVALCILWCDCPFYDHDFIATISLDGGSLFAFLDNLLLMRCLILIVGDGLGIQSHGGTHDGHESEQLQQMAAPGFFM